MFKNLLRLIPFFLLISTSLCLAEDCTDCSHGTKHTNNTLSPVIRLIATPTLLSEDTGISLMGEVGSKNYRISGTLGGCVGFLSKDNRFKVSGEYLSQKLEYSFHSGRLHRWVDQYAVGGGYQYAIPHCVDWSSWLNSVDFNISYSHASSRSLKSVICPLDTLRNETPELLRNIAGGNNIHADLGTTISPWCNGQLFIGVDYDYTHYKRKYQHNITSSGIGGTAWLHQKLGNSFDFDVGAEFRRPFNYYAASLNWLTPFSCGNLSLGVFASYTDGRDQVPNNSMAGVSINFTFGGSPLFSTTLPYTMDYCCMSPCDCDCTYSCDSQLLAWIAKPAVYMPTVLAVADQQYQYLPPPPPVCPPCPPCPPPPPPCIPPSSIPFDVGQSSDDPYVFNISGPFDASPYFFGENLVFTISPVDGFVTIGTFDGIVTNLNGQFGPTLYTITATNDCGSTSETIWLTFVEF